MKGGEALSWIKVGGVALLAFVGVKAAIGIADKLKQGAAAGKAIVDTAKEVVTKDLNPASSENVVYKGVNTLTGGDNAKQPLGARIWEYFHPAEMEAERAGAANISSDELVMRQSQEAFRRMEVEEENRDAAVDAQMSNARSNFRLTEIIAENNPEVYVPAFYPNFVRK